ncbi:DUF411 domain-containing protein [Rhizobium sp. TRM95796]|uniref:DUF411 domain-containing protein n=1 Tax=Rhizobium sp. TRM95796 TaxID=2979862 RepID=UPI0021E8B596|nr:DUF411 domain-containing protein [Rhizobium sp. TRM95796]MCV3765125.1 DUF411 domain-containing protein [Rhizobium sp. TRM95796]
MKTDRRQFLAGSVSALLLAVLAKPTSASPTVMTVHKDPNCGCCHLWAEAMQNAGFDVQLNDLGDLAPIKAHLGVPAELEGCHTAEIDGYFLEGHVPLSSVRKLLAERPPVKGLAVPGMPSGSLGMGDDPSASYDVVAVPLSGKPYLFEAVRPKA